MAREETHVYGFQDPPEQDEIVRLLDENGNEIDARKTENGLEDVVCRVETPGVNNTTVSFILRGREDYPNDRLRTTETYEREIYEELNVGSFAV